MRVRRTGICGAVGCLLVGSCGSSQGTRWSVPAEQADFFDDNLISRSEYEEASRRYLACIESFGGQVRSVEVEPAGARLFSYEIFIPEEIADGDELVYDCDDRYLSSVRDAWVFAASLAVTD